MVSMTTMLCVAIVVLQLMISYTVSEMSQESVDVIENGISGGENMFSFFSSLGDAENNKIFDGLGKMANFLGAAGGLVSFALSFVPKADSDELKYMKKKFAEVNRKLDKITLELDDVKDLITYENQRAVYVGSANKIKFAHKQLLEFLNELQNTSCTDKNTCKREKSKVGYKFVNDFDVKKDIFKILNGAVKTTEIFTDPLISLVKKTFKCDVGKIDHLVNGIVKLAFTAQQAILAHEKLFGTKTSITQSMNVWLKQLYDLRSSVYITKKQCFDKIPEYIIRDINDKKYQFDVSSNVKANREIKKFMEKKYIWVDWVAHSYGADGDRKHCVHNVHGKFWNMPDERKRNLIVSPVDKDGTYTDQKYQVINALDYIVRYTNFIDEHSNACKLLPAIIHKLKVRGVWKYITSLTVLRKYSDLQIEANSSLTYISKEFIFRSTLVFSRQGDKYTQKDTVRLVIILKSMEEANKGTCDNSCKNQGSCFRQPYSSTKYCQCKPYYQGNRCEEHAKARLAKTMDAMLETTFSLPMLSDIAYDIGDLREYVGISFGTIQSAISELEVVFKKAFEELNRKLTKQFQWSNLVTHYSNAIRQIKYYAYSFEALESLLEVEKKQLASTVLAADGIKKWLYELNYLYLGRKDIPLISHKSLMVVFMSRYESQACNAEYKAAVDNTWRQLVLLQQTGFMIWAQALEIMGRSTEHTAKLYKTRTANQVSSMKQSTCEYSITNSVNVQCKGGWYLHPGMNVITHCIDNYYVTGAAKSTCVSKGSGCDVCNCNAAGSKSLECSDLHGQCSCKDGFYGTKCENRDCVWSSWSGYSPCSKQCDYGGTEKRTRYHHVTQQGKGKPCSGSDQGTRNCFKGCCHGQFLCTRNHKCIPEGKKCNYDNDCGNNEDEQSCDEKCSIHYSNWNAHGGGHIGYLDRQKVQCPNNLDVLQMFELRREGYNIRYKYRCCTLKASVCRNEKVMNSFSYHDDDGKAFYLDRQRVSCNDHGYVRDFWLERNGGHDHIRYNYHCCTLFNENQRKRMKCDTHHTGFTTDGEGKNFYLDRQKVECKKKGYFLTTFQLHRNGGHDQWRYEYRCCKIEP